jgi:transposase InsO family protein
MRRHEFSAVGRRATCGRDERRLERFAEEREDLPDRPRLGDEYDEPDVATTPLALQRKFLAHPRHEFGLGDPQGVMGPRFVA